MPRRPFEKVSAGPGVVYDTEYNAFLDVARRVRGGEDVDLTKITKGVVVPCVNRTDASFRAFDAVELLSPVIVPEPDANEFKHKTPVLHIGEISATNIGYSPLPKFGILQAACAAGDSSRVMVRGITPAYLRWSLYRRIRPDNTDADISDLGKTIFLRSPYAHITGRRLSPYVVGQAEIIYQQDFPDVKYDEVFDLFEVLALIHFPVIHHELVRARALEPMPYSEDEFYRVEIDYLGRWPELAFNDWLNVTVQADDRVHLAYFADKQRLSVITCCNTGAQPPEGVPCPCLAEAGVCNVYIRFANVEVADVANPCPTGDRWNTRDWHLYPPIGAEGQDACRFVAQDRNQAQFRGQPCVPGFNAWAEFPCIADDDECTYLVLEFIDNGDCADNLVQFDMVMRGKPWITAQLEDSRLFGVESMSVVYAYDNLAGDGDADIQNDRAANSQGTFFPATSTPNLQDGTGTECHNYTASTPSDEPYDWDFGGGRVKSVKTSDTVVYDGAQWQVIPFPANQTQYLACELTTFIDPYGWSWLEVIQGAASNISVVWELCT